MIRRNRQYRCKEQIREDNVIIPARYGSSRLAGKVLAKETGKYLVQHTYERALSAKLVDEVIIAADDQRIEAACREFSAPCVMTRPDHPSGTDRIAEAATRRQCDIVVNLQADEPEIDPAYIDRVAELLVQHPEANGNFVGLFRGPKTWPIRIS